MKSPKELLSDIEKQNDVDARIKRRNVLNELRNRLHAWIEELDARKLGPSRKEAGCIADELEGYICQFRNT